MASLKNLDFTPFFNRDLDLKVHRVRPRRKSTQPLSSRVRQDPLEVDSTGQISSFRRQPIHPIESRPPSPAGLLRHRCVTSFAIGIC